MFAFSHALWIGEGFLSSPTFFEGDRADRNFIFGWDGRCDEKKEVNADEWNGFIQELCD